MKIITTGKVNDHGEAKIFNRGDFTNSLKAFSGKNITITVEEVKKKRSNKQNSAYHGYILPMVWEGLKDLGWQVTKEWTHDHLREKFLQANLINEKTGELKSYTKRTSQLTTIQFNEYIAQIQQYGSEDINIYIPDPNEQMKIEI
jgi:hypothetical protein